MPTERSVLSVLRAVFTPRWSIASRLTRHYVLSTAILLLASTAYLYFGLRESLAEQDHALVESKVKVLRVLLEQFEDDPTALRNEIEHEAGEESVLKYFLRVLDADGNILVETPGMSEVLPAALFLPPGGREDPLAPAEREVTCGRHYLIGSALAGIGSAPAARRVLHVALDISRNDEVLDAYRNNLAAVFLAGIAIAALVGAGVARAGLRPLAEIARTTHLTNAARLNARISVQRWPDELVELAREFDAMLGRLEESFQRLDGCTADMAHALRNPINNLRGEAEVLLQRPRTPPDYQQALASSLEELDRLSRMIDGLLFIARAEDVNTAIERQVFAVRAQMGAVCDFYEALAAERQIAVTCEGDATLHADPMLVRRAISNLLANALKHTAAGGRVTIAASERPDGGVEIRVTDTGKGIPAEHRDKVFERFYQVDKTRDQPAKGAGLGLAIVRSIMRLHRGEVSLTSELGQGTKVTLVFPRRSEANQSSHSGF